MATQLGLAVPDSFVCSAAYQPIPFEEERKKGGKTDRMNNKKKSKMEKVKY